MTGSQYCTFSVDDIALAVPVAQVQEVMRHQPVTPVPGAPPEVRGLINLRGQIVVALDLRRRLGRPDTGEVPLDVVVRSGGESVALLVDAIGEVIEVGEERPLPVPANLPAPLAVLAAGVLPLAGRIVVVLDVDAAVELPSAPERAPDPAPSNER